MTAFSHRQLFLRARGSGGQSSVAGLGFLVQVAAESTNPTGSGGSETLILSTLLVYSQGAWHEGL